MEKAISERKIRELTDEGWESLESWLKDLIKVAQRGLVDAVKKRDLTEMGDVWCELDSTMGGITGSETRLRLLDDMRDNDLDLTVHRFEVAAEKE